MKIIKWKLLDAYKLQTAKDNERSQVYLDRIAKARERVTTASVTRELLLRREAIEGINLSAELAEARREMAVATEELKMALEDSTRIQHIVYEANAADTNRITPLMLVRDWRKVHEPKVRKEQLEPIQRLAEMGRAMTLNAIVLYYELERGVNRHYTNEHENLRGVRNENGHTEIMPGLHWQVRNELKLITDEELAEAQRGNLPKDVKREKGEEE